MEDLEEIYNQKKKKDFDVKICLVSDMTEVQERPNFAL